MLLMQYIFQSIVFAEEIYHDKYILSQTQQDRLLQVEQFGNGELPIVILATIHGTESIGTPLLNQMSTNLYQNAAWTAGRTIYCISMVNPDGFVGQTRGNRENIDINRNFPTENFGRGWFHGDAPLDSTEAEILMSFLMEIQPKRVLSIHQPLNGIDYDGPSKELAEELSAVSGIRIHKLGSRSGSLGTFLGVEMNIPVITLEISEKRAALSPERLWVLYEPFLVTFITG